MAPETDDLLRPVEVARRLKVSPRQVYRLIVSNRLESTTLPGTKTVRVFASSVENYIREGANAPAR